MWLLLFLACTTETTRGPDAAEQAKADDKAQPSGDEVLQRFLEGSRQCDLMTADNYTIKWDSITTNTKKVAFQEKVLQSGRQGETFIRMHERLEPNWGLTAFGRTGDGTYWSAAETGVTRKVEGDIVKQLMQSLDPTPACAFQARWTDRINLGTDDFEGEPCWHLMLTWADGSSSEAWFQKDDGMLRSMRTRAEGFELRRDYKDYTESNGIYWPREEKMLQVLGDERLIVISKLTDLTVSVKTHRDLGPDHVEAILQIRAKNAADQKKKQKK